MWRFSHSAASNLLYIVKRPYGLSQDNFNITMASYHLEDNLGKCPVYEVRRVREQNGPEDEQEEPVIGDTLIGFFRSAECTDVYEVYKQCSPNAMLPSTLYRGKLVRHHNVASWHGPLNECRVLLYYRR
ncbi:hypothetical protein CRG98_037606 [Punica granatum]|uniref:Uncharacterized protein n=1 Tax=Punica granatum TaxID=22663 RepID=A0A2I0IDA6_PUNGR|nr:hypothetical protein CRG98_037606 [Punica granatum]